MGKKFTRFVLVADPMEVYVASDAVTYVLQLSTVGPVPD
jgi:hypothetical protein